MDLKHVKRFLEVANNELPKVEQIYKNLYREIMDLNLKKRNATETILKLNGGIIYLRNATEYQRLECEKLYRFIKKKSISKNPALPSRAH